MVNKLGVLGIELPPGKARLTIKNVPSGVRIYIDGKDTGVDTPGTVDIDMD